MTYINNLLWATRYKFGKQNKTKLNLQFAQQTRIKSKGIGGQKTTKQKAKRIHIYNRKKHTLITI